MQWLLYRVRDVVRTVRGWREYRQSRRVSRGADQLLLGLVPAERQKLCEARRQFGRNYFRPLDPPLISITVATYNRSQILLERTLPSLLAQDYPRLEVIIVGDGCTDDTMDRLSRWNHPRVRFENLAERQDYPEDRVHRHLVSGVKPLNRAVELAQGDWIAHCDDDEIFVSNHLTLLWEFAERRGSEYVWAQQLQEVEPGKWIQQGSATPHLFDVPHTTLMYRSYLRCFAYDAEAWRIGLCHDRHRLRRMRLAGVRSGFLPQVVTMAPLRPNTTRPWAAAEDRA
ncbi:MAG TPA: glycosyltransferase family A protein [Planctomycetaceae bacterium]|nr:glycosyltransferase family A protein [Planctomycetaceae bacterium]